MLQFIAALLLSATAAVACAAGATQAVDASAPPAHPLGERMAVLVEAASPMGLEDVLPLAGTDRFAAASTAVLGLGIGHRPIWARLVVDNPTGEALPRMLAIGPTWIDRLEVHVVQAGQATASWRSGDAVAGVPLIDEALGYVVEHRFPPGRSEVFVRAQTDDPLVLDVRLLTPQQAARAAAVERYAYGFLYGFLGALIIYNLVMYLNLRRRNGLFYSVYLLGFVALNLSYTGRGLAWLWPEAVDWQRFVILCLMVLTSCAGLRFAREFLELDQRAPRTARTLRGFCRTAFGLMALAIVLDRQEAAAWLAFGVMGVFAFVMIGLGIFALRHRQSAAGYFLVASMASMFGVGLTVFAVWGFIPFNTWTYRGMEVGMMLDATLLSLAVAKFVRLQMLERQRAERDARHDPLTQLLNRRGFYEQAEAACHTAMRHQRPLSLVLLDLDHFKTVNDSYGHGIGDLVLIETGKVLAQSIRRGDIVARWGGEEFILLLPETDMDAAAEFAERIRAALVRVEVPHGTLQVGTTASFGVGQLGAEPDLDALIHCVDKALYAAKVAGRDRVMRTRDLEVCREAAVAVAVSG